MRVKFSRKALSWFVLVTLIYGTSQKVLLPFSTFMKPFCPSVSPHIWSFCDLVILGISAAFLYMVIRRVFATWWPSLAMAVIEEQMNNLSKANNLKDYKRQYITRIGKSLAELNKIWGMSDDNT